MYRKIATAATVALLLASSAASAQFMDRRSPGQQALEEALAELDEAAAPIRDAQAEAQAKVVKDYAKAIKEHQQVIQWYLRGGLDLPQQRQPKTQ